MYELSRLLQIFKTNVVVVLVSLVCLLVVFCSGYFYGVRNADTGTGRNEDHNTDRIEHVTNEIERGLTEQREITERLDGLANQTESIAGRINKSETGISGSADRIAEVESRIADVEREIDKSRTAIEDCQRILEKVRSRVKTGTPTP